MSSGRIRFTFLFTLVFLAARVAVAVAVDDAQNSRRMSTHSEEAYDVAQFQAHRLIESRVNTFTDNHQQDQSLSIDDEGCILVTWGSRRQELGTFGVYAQYLDPAGHPLGTEMHINRYSPGHQVKPAVAFAPDRSAWIAWCSTGQDGQLGGIYLRHLTRRTRYDNNGKKYNTLLPAGGEIRVNQTARGDQFDPTVTVGSSGRVFVCWVSAEGEAQKVYGRLFDDQGKSIGNEFRLSTVDGGIESLPSTAALDEDRVVVVWARSHRQGGSEGIFGRIFDGSSPETGTEIRISGPDQALNVEPCVDSNGSDRFIVTWMSRTSIESGDYQVTARLFDGRGRAVDETLLLPASGTGYVNGASAAMAPDGRFLLSYNVHHEDTGPAEGHRPERFVSIRGRVFDRHGKPLSGDFRLNGFDEGEQNLQVGLNAHHVVWSGRDQVALVWHGNIDGDKDGVGLSLWAPEDLQVRQAPAIEPLPADAVTPEVFALQRENPPDWDPGWVDDSYMPSLPPAGTDFGFEAFTSTGWNPPDPDLAVGPDYIVGVVNIWIRFFDKTGGVYLDQDLSDFFGSTYFSFDPIALYDPLEDRFVVASAEHDGGNDFLNIAVSDDNDPNGTWYKYRFEITSICDNIDFPNLSSGPDAYYISADCFGPFRNDIYIFDKAAMLNGDPVVLDNIRTSSSLLSLGGSKVYDADAGAAYFASSWATSSPNIKLYAVTDPTGSPQLHSVNVNVGPYGYPPDAEQQGSSNRVDTIDDRIKNGVVRDGQFYLCHTVNGGDGAAKSRWYHIDLRGWPNSGQNPIKVDGGDIDPGYNIDTWFGDINVDSRGNIAIAYNRSSPDELIGVYRSYRLAGDPPGEMREGVELQTSTTPETGPRWGDYGGLEEDPAEPGSFWNHHEYRTSSWRTWMGHFVIEDEVVPPPHHVVPDKF